MKDPQRETEGINAGRGGESGQADSAPVAIHYVGEILWFNMLFKLLLILF